ncbi:MAG: zf-TFIIB domain-containing protein [Myxococcales bacterium]|nr:zf-TFIIB domain-containing protein [Myxococcales bacterium]
MNCPRCRHRTLSSAYREAPSQPVALLDERHASGATLHRCKSCFAVFAPHGSLELVESHARDLARVRVPDGEMVRRAFAPTRPSRAAIRCPACDGEMNEREWRTATLVFVDVCAECRGVWLDPEEFEALEATFRSER